MSLREFVVQALVVPAFVVPAFVVPAFVGMSLVTSVSQSAELEGTIVDENDQPIDGALVSVSTCRPRVGPGTLCPSCYPDCRKRVRTDAKGHFELTGLSSKLTFSLGVGAPDFQGTVTDHIDPENGDGTVISLRKLPSGDNVRRVSGRVVNRSGDPIIGAEVRGRMYQKGNRFTSRPDPTVTPLTLTDEDGRFVVTVGKDISSATWRVSASGYAPVDSKWTLQNPPSTESIEVRLGRGASLRGQLMFHGEPVSGARVGIVQENRVIGNIVTPEEVAANENGVFRFDSLPPDLDYAVYTLMHQEVPGVLPVSLVKLPGDGKLADLGTIETQPARKLQIRIETTDGSPLPDQGILYVGRGKAWQTSVLRFGGDKKSTADLKLESAANEMVQISVRVKGYSVESTQPPMAPDMNRRYPLRIGENNEVIIRMKKSDPAEQDSPFQ